MDDEIRKLWSQNPEKGFRLLYERYSGVLLRFVYRFTGNQEQAEEILHDVFTEVLKQDVASSDFLIKPWLFTVAKNKSLNFERKKKRETPSEELLASAIDPRHMEEEFATAQILSRIDDFQNRLPKDLSTTWDLRKQGRDYQEIADELQIPLGTVKSRFSRLVEYLKKEFNIENAE